MAQITIFVTQSDIANGKKGDCEKCAIARAVERRLKKDFFAEVGGSGDITVNWIKKVTPHDFYPSITIRDYTKVFYVEGDKRRAAFIADFDSLYNRNRCKPFQFKLDYPDHLGWVFAK